MKNTVQEAVEDEEPLWRQNIRKQVDEQAALVPAYGDDENGDYCRFNPDGTKDILKTATSLEEYNCEFWGERG